MRPDQQITIVGNPGSRRVAGFRAAVLAAGLPEPHLLAWRDVARGGAIEIAPEAWVRIDSPGEDAEVDSLLRGIATGRQPVVDATEVTGSRAWYQGFAVVLRRIATAAHKHGAQLLNDPDDILTMFDKARCHARLSVAMVPVPPALRTVTSYHDLRSAMAERGWTRVFVKSRHGSSASGVVALAVRTGQVLATTSVELVRSGEGVRLYNSLRVRRYDNEGDIASIVDSLAGDGVHVERWFPKAGMDHRVVDARVVVIAGRPTHVVGRASRAPMTNLHLGADRVDAVELRRAAGNARYDAAMATCANVSRCFPGSTHVGVDLMFSSSWHSHAVAEVNAFGDLLPGLVVDGRDTYAAQIDALLKGQMGAAEICRT